MNAQATPQVNQQRYTLVCGDRFRGRAVYRSPDSYYLYRFYASSEQATSAWRPKLTLTDQAQSNANGGQSQTAFTTTL